MAHYLFTRGLSLLAFVVHPSHLSVLLKWLWEVIFKDGRTLGPCSLLTEQRVHLFALVCTTTLLVLVILIFPSPDSTLA